MINNCRIHILVVDDEEDIRTIFEFNFEDEVKSGSVKMSYADSGVTCLDFLETADSSDVKLILSDINMPKMDGLELLEKLKGKYGEIVVYMISAYDTENFIQKAKSLGAKKFLSKPVDFDELKEIIFKDFGIENIINNSE